MSQSQIQEQLQQLKQGQAFSHQQLLQASLVELPITQLMDRITTLRRPPRVMRRRII